MGQVMRIVVVTSGLEVGRATVSDDGTGVAYGGRVARGVVAARARDDGTTEAVAVVRLLADGWSNGYLMVPLDEIGGS